MDREKDRDAAEELIEEHDEKQGGGEPERVRPGQGNGTSRSVDSQKPPPDQKPPDENKSPKDDAPASSDPSPFAPR